MGALKISSIFPWIQIDDVKTYTLAEVKEIQVSMTSEDIHIYQAEAGSEIRFHYYGKSWPGRQMLTKTVDGKVTVWAEEKPGIERLQLDVFLPVDYQRTLGVKSTSGEVNMESFDLAGLRVDVTSGDFKADPLQAASVSIHTTSGEVDTAGIEAARLTITTSSGEIKTGPCTVDEAVMETSSGSIRVGSITGDVDLKTTSGDVHLTYTGQDNPRVKVESTSGEISVVLPAEAEFTLDSKATSGEIESEFPVTVSGRSGRNHLSGMVGNGTGQVTLKATSGDILILKK